MRQDRPDKRFSDRACAVPFGRYQAGSEAEPPADEVLVGREGQRSYFIDLLLRSGRRGAYLVTGHRGVGKTSFVRHCLAEYTAEVFERFLRNNVGRAALWDRAVLFLLGIIALVLILVISEFLDLLTLAHSVDPGSPRTILLWLVIAPLALLCLYPMLFAREVLTEVVEAVRHRGGRGRPDTMVANLLTLILAVVVWLYGPFGAPAVSMSRLFCAICMIYLWVRSTSFGCHPEKGRYSCYSWRSIRVLVRAKPLLVCIRLLRWRILIQPRRWGLVNIVFLVIVMSFVFAGPGYLISGIISPENEFWGNIGLGLALLGCGSIIHGIYRKLRSHTARASLHPAGSWYLWSGLFTFLFALFLLNERGAHWALPFAVMLAIVSAVTFICVKRWYRRKVATDLEVSFRPRPLLALSVKALLSLIIALQLVHPVLAKWSKIVDSSNKSAYQSTSEERRLHSPVALYRMPGVSVREAEIIGKNVFHHRDEEVFWIVSLLLSLIVLYYLDYEWVVRPFLREREDSAIDPAWFFSSRDFPGKPERHDRRTYRRLASITLPWLLYRAWLPVIIVSVNLGFERLDHRRVVQAMLTGLRDKYYRAFLAWNSGLANLGRVLGFIVLMMLVALAGERLFSLPEIAKSRVIVGGLGADAAVNLANSNYENICDSFRGRQRGSSVVNLICQMPWGNEIFHFLYFNLATSKISALYQGQNDHLLFYFFPYIEQEWPSRTILNRNKPLPVLLERGIHFRVYHIFLFILFFFVGRWMLNRFPMLPYNDTLTRIDGVLDSLTSSTSVTSTTGRWRPAQWLEGFFTDERVRQIQQDPVDPRTVEFAFLQILEEIQAGVMKFPGGRNQLLSLPVPEVTFIFDELDKLGTRIDPAVEDLAGGNPQQVEILSAERKRSLELHKLLADMKNMLSSAPARFIFVGGRNLHDEWLADQTARQPLLTNIFSAEVYLPSLLTDHSRRSLGEIEQKVGAYLQVQLRRARLLYSRFQRKLRSPELSLYPEEYAVESYVQGAGGQLGQGLTILKALHPETGGLFSGRYELSRDFVQFLTYRSMGNPKRLKELLGTFVRPVGRVVVDQGIRDKYDCQHVLLFDDTERFRLQLLARVYRQLVGIFERDFARRDDKMTVSVFYLADFLFKFHRRSFSWSNLERVDELVHIHRAPDLREVLEEMIVQWSERFLHRIRNGMYDFRFRSELAREVEYLSRKSPGDMAAFNFTLDESQALKSVYEWNILRLKEEGSKKELQDVVAGLGELHEFDQAYETARFYYRRAISLLDAELKEVMGGSPVFEEESPMIEIMGGKPTGEKGARLYMTWGVARLRLMLQVGMTFELSRNFERAAVEYQNARTLAKSLLLSMLDEIGRDRAADLGIRVKDYSTRGDRLHALKHLNILFQPLFAEAWIAEKLGGGVDTSITLAERELWELRNLLPFVRDRRLQLSVGPVGVKHSNFSLIASELHNKLGDLYFFKGSQVVGVEDIQKIRNESVECELRRPRRSRDGYLLRAHYHYAVGLHELRRFTTYRRLSSRTKLNIWSKDIYGPDGLWETISKGGWPDFVYRAAGGTFNDFAEVMLGRVSLFGLFQGLEKIELKESERKGQRAAAIEFVAACSEWMESGSASSALERTGVVISLEDGSFDAGSLEGWLGEWNSVDGEIEPDSSLVDFGEANSHDDLARLAVALNFMLVGAKFLERGGYIEDAAREYLKVAEAVAHYVWWGQFIQSLIRRQDLQEPRSEALKLVKNVWTESALFHSYWDHLVDVALYSLGKTDRLFRRSRGREEGVQYLVGGAIPCLGLTMACSLGLVVHQRYRESLNLQSSARKAEHGEQRYAYVEDKLRGLLTSWVGSEARLEKGKFADGLRELIKDSLVRHSYPMINRLHGLKLLVDDAVTALPLDSKPERRQEIMAWVHELLDLSGSLNGPLHFTPLHSGTTCALVYLHLWDPITKGQFSGADPQNLERIRRAAQRDLLNSQEMYTMRRAFYENISDLYYLYDDFNDRQVHFNHALQIAGGELVALLGYLVNRPDYWHWRK